MWDMARGRASHEREMRRRRSCAAAQAAGVSRHALCEGRQVPRLAARAAAALQQHKQLNAVLGHANSIILYASSAAHGRVFTGGGSGGGRRAGGRLGGAGAGCVWLQCSMPHSGAHTPYTKPLDRIDARNCSHSNQIILALSEESARIHASHLTLGAPTAMLNAKPNPHDRAARFTETVRRCQVACLASANFVPRRLGARWQEAN